MKVRRSLRPWHTVTSILNIETELGLKQEHEKQYRRIYRELLVKGHSRSKYASYEVLKEGL